MQRSVKLYNNSIAFLASKDFTHKNGNKNEYYILEDFNTKLQEELDIKTQRHDAVMVFPKHHQPNTNVLSRILKDY